MSNKKQLAIICSRFPFPLNKGDKLRMFHQIKGLAKDFDIHLFAINDENINSSQQQSVRQYCKSVHLFRLNYMERALNISASLLKGEPVQVGYFFSKRIRNKINQLYKELNIDIVYGQLSRTAKYANAFAGPKCLDYQDCFSKNYERAAVAHQGLKAMFYKREMHSMQKFEQWINQYFETTTIISDFDKKALPFNAEKVKVIPNGVDTEYYAATNATKAYDLLFSGNLAYEPNEKAALYCINELAPRLIQLYPNIKIGIAGNTTNKHILNAQSKHIHIQPNVLDMRKEYEKTKIYIAPLFTGAGLQNKLLEAMSMKIACITTDVCNASLQANANHEIILANTSDEFLTQINLLLTHDAQREALASNGQEFIQENYSWHKANDLLSKCLFEIL